MSDSAQMAPSRPPPPFPESDFEARFVSKVKVRYRIEKLLGESWTTMALFPGDSSPRQREDLCAALGGEVRVIDVEHSKATAKGKD